MKNPRISKKKIKKVFLHSGKKAAAVFLDRDGVINKDEGYVCNIEQIEIIDGIPEALSELKAMGFLLIVITNQSSVARGFCSEKDVVVLHEYMRNFFKTKYGVTIDAFFYCPHHIKGTVREYSIVCECRKPGTKMLEDAKAMFDIDLSASFLIGDKPSDIECGIRGGVRSIQILNDKYGRHDSAFGYAGTIGEAVLLIKDSFHIQEN
ncbi:MAG: HAD family hydrolase [Oligoflexales bacterium]|nr:HAD family hydrolase [Oligoflexales bacterium]